MHVRWKQFNLRIRVAEAIQQYIILHSRDLSSLPINAWHKPFRLSNLVDLSNIIHIYRDYKSSTLPHLLSLALTKILPRPCFSRLTVPSPSRALRPTRGHLSPRHPRILRQVQVDSSISLTAPLRLRKFPPNAPTVKLSGSNFFQLYTYIIRNYILIRVICTRDIERYRSPYRCRYTDPLDRVQPVIDPHLYAVRELLRAGTNLRQKRNTRLQRDMRVIVLHLWNVLYLLLLIIVYCTGDEGRHVQKFGERAPTSRRILTNRDALGNTARKVGQAVQQRAIFQRLVRAVEPKNG